MKGELACNVKEPMQLDYSDKMKIYNGMPMIIWGQPSETETIKFKVGDALHIRIVNCPGMRSPGLQLMSDDGETPITENLAKNLEEVPAIITIPITGAVFEWMKDADHRVRLNGQNVFIDRMTVEPDVYPAAETPAEEETTVSVWVPENAEGEQIAQEEKVEIPATPFVVVDVKKEEIVKIKATDAVAPSRGLGGAVTALAASDISILKKNSTDLLVADDQIRVSEDASGYEFTVSDEATVTELKTNGFDIKNRTEKPLVIKAIEVQQVIEPTFAEKIAAALAAGTGEVTVTMEQDETLDAAVSVPVGKQLVLNGDNHTLKLGAETNFSLNDGITLKNVKIDATALTKPLIDIADVPATKAKKADDTDSEYGILSDITLDNVAITALGKSLINNSKGKVLFNKVLVDKSVVEVIGSNAVFALGNGYPTDLQINNSTFWSKDGHTGFLFQAHGKAIDINPDYKTSWSIDKSTLYQIAVGKKMNNTNTFKGKDYLVMNLSNSILYNVGTNAGNEVNGWLFGQNSTTPTITYANNTYWATEGAVAGWTDASKTGSDQTGTSLTTNPSFAGAATGDFTIGASTAQAKAQTGDPRWVVEYVKANFNTLVQNALDEVASGAVTVTLIDNYDVAEAVTVPAGKQLTINGDNHTLKLGAETNFSLNDGITLKNVKIDATALTKPLIDIADVPATKAKKADDTDSEYGILSDITLDNVAITALGKSLINNSKGKVLFNKVLVDKSVVEVIGSNAVFALGNGYPTDLQINNSTFWSKDGHTGFLFQAHGKAIDINPDYKTSWSIDKSTLYQIAVGKKMNNTNTFKGKDYLVMNLSNSILYNVGTNAGNEVNGWLFGQNSTTPTITYANNTYWATEGAVAGWTDASKTGSDQTGTSLTTNPSFADAATGDFTIGATTMQAREATGDPRWVIPFVAPTDVDKTALAATITEAEALVAPEETAPDNVKTAWATVTTTLATAQTVNADANVFQDEVDAANTALADAIAAYNTATGITNINIDNNGVAGEKDVYYNLQGVRVANPGKGVYIKNGKKVLVK